MYVRICVSIEYIVTHTYEYIYLGVDEIMEMLQQTSSSSSSKHIDDEEADLIQEELDKKLENW